MVRPLRTVDDKEGKVKNMGGASAGTAPGGTGVEASSDGKGTSQN
jgi:hypothetical protein